MTPDDMEDFNEVFEEKMRKLVDFTDELIQGDQAMALTLVGDLMVYYLAINAKDEEHLIEGVGHVWKQVLTNSMDSFRSIKEKEANE